MATIAWPISRGCYGLLMSIILEFSCRLPRYLPCSWLILGLQSITDSSAPLNVASIRENAEANAARPVSIVFKVHHACVKLGHDSWSCCKITGIDYASRAYLLYLLGTQPSFWRSRGRRMEALLVQILRCDQIESLKEDE